MEPEMLPPGCQIKGLVQMSEPLGWIDVACQLRHKVKRVIKRRLVYIRNWLSRTSGVLDPPAGKSESYGETLVAGLSVRVKSRDEIQATLDCWNQLKGCAFMEEMWQYCGTSQRVFKKVEKFLDERDYRIKRCKGIVLLEGIMCEGTVDFGPCDRSCYYFWREEWLVKVD